MMSSQMSISCETKFHVERMNITRKETPLTYRMFPDEIYQFRESTS